MLFITISSAGLYVIYSRKAAAYTSTEKTFIMSAAGALVFTVFAVVEHAAAGTFREFIILPFTNHDFLISLLYLSVALHRNRHHAAQLQHFRDRCNPHRFLRRAYHSRLRL